MNRVCGDCDFWVSLAGEKYLLDIVDGVEKYYVKPDDAGECRRRAPVWHMGRTIFPSMKRTAAGCGEFRGKVLLAHKYYTFEVNTHGAEDACRVFGLRQCDTCSEKIDGCRKDNPCPTCGNLGWVYKHYTTEPTTPLSFLPSKAEPEPGQGFNGWERCSDCNGIWRKFWSGESVPWSIGVDQFAKMFGLRPPVG